MGGIVIKFIKSSVFLSLTFASVFSLATSQSSDSAECGYVDFRNEFQLKMRDQKSLAWCFAHASADNLQFIEKSNVQISAADIAINYGKSNTSKIINLFQRWTSQGASNDDRPNEYGLAKFASQMIVDEGFCPESYFPSTDWERVDSSGQVEQVEIAQATHEIYELSAAIKNHEINESNQMPFYYRFKTINKEKFYSILNQFEKNKILNQLRQSACDSVRVPFKKNIKIDMKLNFNGMTKAMNQSLSSGRAFSVDVYNQIFDNIDNNKNSFANLHTVMVYGRKYDVVRKQCLYMIKNSYSESCEGYDSRLHCDKGYLWFPGSVLQKNMTSAVFYR